MTQVLLLSIKSKDEFLPQAYSDFRPEIDGYYQKGKVDTNSQGFNITSDGIRTETSKGIIISQNIFDGGSSLSNIKVAKNEIFAQRYFLKNVEQEVFLEAIKLDFINFNINNFYYISRSSLVKDERLIDRFDIVFSQYFKGVYIKI